MAVTNYCTINDVNNIVPQSPFTPTTTPTQAQVEALISAVSLRTDATLANLGYVTPVVQGPIALALLREAVAWGAYGLASQSRITAIAPDQAVGLSVWTKQYNQWLVALADNTNPFELPDAPRTNKAVIKPLGEIQLDMTSSSIDSGTVDSPSNYLSMPNFSMNMKF